MVVAAAAVGLALAAASVVMAPEASEVWVRVAVVRMTSAASALAAVQPGKTGLRLLQ